jgi:ribosomal protein S6--L-glutamate ligase
VSLPSLGVTALLAKIDTGARTSALHVARMKVVGSSGLPRRPILEITIPGKVKVARPASKAARSASVVRVQVRDWALVKDTSGRTERRPVIETTLHIGPLERRIRLTLTDRGDMLYPMLVGRTALGNGVVVDPSQRRVLREAGAPAKVPRGRRKRDRAQDESG